jgi:hypothetical protein
LSRNSIRLGSKHWGTRYDIIEAYEIGPGPGMNANTRYYFNVISSSSSVIDIEGVELSSLEEARDEALEDARFLMSAAILEGLDISARHIEVCNETGDVLMRIPFTAAYTVSD